MNRLDGIRWRSWGADPGVLAPFNRDRRSFVRLVWGGPWLRPVSFGLANPWTEWRAFTIRIPWFAGVFVSLRLWRALIYLGAGKCYPVGADHTYARPAEIGKAAATFSLRIGWEPFV